ncbi:MAG TPA: hypothetical protein VF165_23680 [Nocardioidaceae bacterium]
MTASCSTVFFAVVAIFFTEAFCVDAGAFAAALLGELFFAAVPVGAVFLAVVAAVLTAPFLPPVPPALVLVVLATVCAVAFFGVGFFAVVLVTAAFAVAFFGELFVVAAGDFFVGFAVVVRFAVLVLPAPDAFLAGAFFADVLVAGAFAADFLVTDLVAGAFFADALVAGAFFADVLVAGAFFAADFLVTDLAAGAFFAADFFAAGVAGALAAFLALAVEDFVAVLVADPPPRVEAALVVVVLLDLRVTVEVTRLAAAAVLPASFFAVVRAMAEGPPIQPGCVVSTTRVPRGYAFTRMASNKSAYEHPCVRDAISLADLEASQGVDGTSSRCTAVSDPGTV